jgi:hypothetical protein
MNRRTLHFFTTLLLITGCEQRTIGHQPANQPGKNQHLVVPAKGAYTGAYIDFGDHEDTVTLEQIEAFEKMVGKHQAIVASSSYWGEQAFPSANAKLILRHGSIPLIFWSPWDRPYAEDKGPDKFNLRSILEGKWDQYIDRWADAARDIDTQFFVSFANEMNGTWFPWSGTFYGGNKEIQKNTPETFEGPETFKKTWRYVVDRVRARGAKNILWVFHAMNYSIPQDTWNMAAQYYPGSDYVDWLGLSVYGEQYREEGWSYFSPREKDGKMSGGLLDWPYQEMIELDPSKPIMLAEWGVGQFGKIGLKAEWIREGLRDLREKYPRVKAAIFWHERWQNEDETYSNLRVNSSPEALNAYREGVANLYWIDHPIYAPAGVR